MGTRGTYGVRIDGQDKLAYNHYDSYPGGLGQALVGQLRAMLESGRTLEDLKIAAREMRAIDTDVPPTEEEKAHFAAKADLGVSGQTLDDWYCLLRNAQGDIQWSLENGAIAEANDFIQDSLFCEYGYILNFDTMEFEIYKGFQKQPHDKGRYGRIPLKKDGDRTREYYPSALVETFPLGDVPDIAEWKLVKQEAEEAEEAE